MDIHTGANYSTNRPLVLPTMGHVLIRIRLGLGLLRGLVYANTLRMPAEGYG